MVRIAIIGGGIGGLTAALALRQYGFEPEVFEQAPALLDVGAAIAIWPNAMRVLTRLNLADKIRSLSSTWGPCGPGTLSALVPGFDDARNP